LGTQQSVAFRLHTCPLGQSFEGHVIDPPQLSEMVALHRPAHVARTQHVLVPMLVMHFCPEAQLIDPPAPQATVLPQLSSALPHSFEPHAAVFPSGAHASPESLPGPGASMPGASIAVLSTVVLSIAVLSTAVLSTAVLSTAVLSIVSLLSVVETSAPLLPVSGAVLVSPPVATSAPCASGRTVESADPSAGYGLPSSMPSRKLQPPAAVAHASTNTRTSAARNEAKRFPRFIP
jgi:hypothetical protein